MPELDPIKDGKELQIRLAGPMTFLMLLIAVFVFIALGIQMIRDGDYRGGAAALGGALVVGAAFGFYMAYAARRTRQRDAAQEADREKARGP